MCGIFGQIGSAISKSDEDIQTAGELIKHRGPDDEGWVHYHGGFIANRRLSIIDLNDGHQPFTTPDGRYSLVQNGEIYNYQNLSKELIKKGITPKTNSDTETLLYYFLEFGLAGLNKINGMFCFAFRDNKLNKTVIVRDRVGIKPCFYSHSKKTGLTFSSEMRVIRNLSDSNFKISSKNLYFLMTLGYLPPPFTIYENIHQLKPGYYIEAFDDGSFYERQWWNLPLETTTKIQSRADIIDDIDNLVEKAVKIRTVADVPLGSFLSGGLDSSWISLHLKKYSTETLKTFTLTFPNTNFDESKWAQIASSGIQTKHFERTVMSEDMHLWSKFIYYCEQPHCDISFIPTYLISELASQHVKVILTGDGGDEIFGGYNRHKDFLVNDQFKNNNDVIKHHLKSNRISSLGNLSDYGLFSEAEIKIYENELYLHYCGILEPYTDHDPLNKELILDVLTLLPGNNLVKPDRMGMAHSIEARTPLLDFNILNYMFSLPGHLKATTSETRTLQKDILKKYFSKEFVDREKHMLTVPITDWKKNKTSNSLIDNLTLNGPISQKISKTFLEKICTEHIQDPHSHLKILRLFNSIKYFEDLLI